MSVSHRLLAFDQLTENQRNCWKRLRTHNESLYSPFLSVEFIGAVAELRKGCQVLVLERDGAEVGFLPFEMHGRQALPVARLINDAQAIVSEPEHTFVWRELLRAAGLDCYRFHALVGPVSFSERSSVFGITRSFMCDLKLPEEGYLRWLKKSSRTIAKQQQKTNKLIREIGPLRWDFENRDHDLLTRILNLKSLQYTRTHIFDKFSVPWIRQLMHNLLDSTSDVRGQLSLLWAGEHLVAGHFGLREGNLLHYWFPVYDTAYEIYSPGTALFVELVRCAESLGIAKIDYGYGDIPYKHKLCNVVTEVYQGAFCSSALQTHSLRLRYHAVKGLKKIPAKETIKRVCRKLWPSWGAREHGG